MMSDFNQLLGKSFQDYHFQDPCESCMSNFTGLWDPPMRGRSHRRLSPTLVESSQFLGGNFSVGGFTILWGPRRISSYVDVSHTSSHQNLRETSIFT